jgi:hypothetical protein
MCCHLQKRIVGVECQLVEKRATETVALLSGGERRSGGVQRPAGVDEYEPTVRR